MKSIFITCLITISSLGVYAQEISRNLSTFNEVKVYDKITLELIPANENKIILSGDGSQDVQVVQKNDELKIKLPLTKLLKGEAITAKLYYNSELNEIAAYEGSYIASGSVIKSRNLELEAKEGSQINLEVETTELDVKAVSGAKIIVKGSVSGEIEAEAKAGGEIVAKEIESTRAEAKIQAGGEIHIKTKDHLKAEVKAGGTVYVYGNPAQIEEKTFAGGKVVKR